MQTVEVEVRSDHLETLSRVKKPIFAIAELIWNGLDADATQVRVELERNELDGIKRIVITDNGVGLAYKDAVPAFKNLGGSWKRTDHRTRKGGRLLHGRLGKGRFRAFAIGKTVKWQSRFRSNGGVEEYSIISTHTSLRTFQIGDVEQSRNSKTGMEVEITGITSSFPSLTDASAVQELAENLAPYMAQYRDVEVIYDGKKIDPATVRDFVADYPLSSVNLSDGSIATPALTVIEWRVDTERKLFLCDADGFTLQEIPPGIHARGFNFSAYLKCRQLRDLDERGSLMLAELHPDVKVLLDLAKAKLKEHFRSRAAQEAAKVVQDWKREGTYPFEGDPKSPVEKAEQQVFDVCALSVYQYLPEFDQADVRSRKLAMRLLRLAIESGPSATQKILKEVLELPPDKQEEFAALLQRTSLAAIVTASKVVADRLNFLRALEVLVFSAASKRELLERRQLHRIIADQTWIFGEEFNLTVDDQSLREVLVQHLSLLGEQDEVFDPVKREDGSTGIVDLMLSRRIPHPRKEELEHLVVELKRPSVKIDGPALDQIDGYADAVANDPRFRDTKARWVFWVVSTEVTDRVRSRTNQAGRPPGISFISSDARITVCCKTWGEIINESSARLSFFQEQLRYTADRDSALEYVRQTHAKYLPPSLLNQDQTKPGA